MIRNRQVYSPALFPAEEEWMAGFLPDPEEQEEDAEYLRELVRHGQPLEPVQLP